jgi:hypothetical protein
MTWTLVTLVVTLAAACLVAPAVDAGERTYSQRDVEGPTAFDFDGFAPHPLTGTVEPAASAGRFVADGRGNLNDGERRVVIGGLVLPLQHFTCTYTVRPNGMGEATCVIVGGGTETFDFVIVDSKKEAYFTSTTPGTVLRGRTKRQQ